MNKILGLEDESNLFWRMIRTQAKLTAITFIFHNRLAAWNLLRIIHLVNSVRRFFLISCCPPQILHQQDSSNWKRALVFQTINSLWTRADSTTFWAYYSVPNIKVYIWNLRPAQFVLSNFKLRFYLDVARTFIVEGHIKKISQFSLVKSQFSITSDYSEKPCAPIFLGS